jgi:hypothetical protein
MTNPATANASVPRAGHRDRGRTCLSEACSVPTLPNKGEGEVRAA